MNTRNSQFFESLSPLKRGLDSAIERFGSKEPARPARETRSKADVAELKAKQAAKLARRAARAK